MSSRPRHQETVFEEMRTDIRVRVVKVTGGPGSDSWPDGEIFFAIGSPVKGECCFLAGAFNLEDTKSQITMLLDDPETRTIFTKMAALLGVEWETYDNDARGICEVQE